MIEEEKFKYKLYDIEDRVKKCYEKAMNIGVTVPWKDNNFIEPRYKYITSIENNVSTNEKVDAFDLENIERYNDGTIQAFYVYCIQNGNKQGCPFLKFEETIDKKLFIGNSGAFFLINNDSELEYCKTFDTYLSNELEEDECSDTLDKFCSIDLHVFEKYINSCNKMLNKSGETNLF